MIQYVRKRDGRLEKFEPEKIAKAIHKAIIATGEKDSGRAHDLAQKVVSTLEATYSAKEAPTPQSKIPTVENIQDTVEDILIQHNLSKVAKAYILYRQSRKKEREIKKFFGVKDDLKLGINAIRVLEKRYLKKNELGQVIETPSQMFQRCAKTAMEAEKLHGTSKKEIKNLEKTFYNLMINGEFLPNSPALMNAGTSRQQMSACFVLPIEDSLEDIFGALKTTALIHQTGGGTGFSFSHLRPSGDFIRSTGGRASGPISFMKIFDLATEVIKQGGRRRGANMGVLNFNHPDILEFISVKRDKTSLQNFNLSVAVSDDFIRKAKRNGKVKLIHPRTKKIIGELKASEILNQIALSAWETGDPGIIFLDEINRRNPTKSLGKIETTNPCSEAPLYPYESCNLGSINLSKMIIGKKMDWQKLEKIVKLGVRFLDNIIDINQFPTKQIKEATKANRKIGLGVMGLAEMFILMGTPYNSNTALKLAGKIMRFINTAARRYSAELGRRRGSFPNFKQSVWPKHFKSMRNATITTVAPTGTISLFAGTSSGIEPLFAIAFVRNVMEGMELLEVNRLFEDWLKKNNLWNTDILLKIASTGSLKNIKEIPLKIRKNFVTALDISYPWHIKMQAAIQRYVDNAASKTINLPAKTTVKDILNAFLLAHKLKCKGITVYRYGTKPGQVLTLGLGTEEKSRLIGPEFSGLSEKECGCER